MANVAFSGVIKFHLPGLRTGRGPSFWTRVRFSGEQLSDPPVCPIDGLRDTHPDT